MGWLEPIPGIDSKVYTDGDWLPAYRFTPEAKQLLATAEATDQARDT